MADPVALALKAAFIRLGFSCNAATILADPDKEGLGLETLQYFDDKVVKNLCDGLKKPGGLIDGRVPADGGPSPRLYNPGVYVSGLAMMNLSYACYMARH